MLLKHLKKYNCFTLTHNIIKIQKMRLQQQEIGSLQSIIEQLRSEASTTRERHRRYDDDFMKRSRTLRESARIAIGESERLQAEIVRMTENERKLKIEIDSRDMR